MKFSKFVWNQKGSKTTNSMLGKKRKAEDVTISTFKLYYETIVKNNKVPVQT